MNLLNQLAGLVRDGVIDQATSDRIQHHLELRHSASPGRLLVIFGIIGALLVGTGIILIFAHNWDELSRPVKLILACIPLVIGQIACLYSLLRKSESNAWREASSIFLILAVATAISLISQIYHIEGSLKGFLLTWLLLTFPIMYLMRSNIASLVLIILTTWYGAETGYEGRHSHPWLFLPFIVFGFYHYRNLILHERSSNWVIWHHWAYAVSLTIILGAFGSNRNEELTLLSYVMMFGAFYQIGSLPMFAHSKVRSNAWLVIGSLGIVFLLLITSFSWYWEEVNELNWLRVQKDTAAIALPLIMILVSLISWIIQRKANGSTGLPFLREVVHLIYGGIFLIGVFIPDIAQLLINLLVLLLAVSVIRRGVQADHFGILNYGLLIFAALVMCRFFDSNLSFVVRGVLFIVVGAGFFYANYSMMKRRKQFKSQDHGQN